MCARPFAQFAARSPHKNGAVSQLGAVATRVPPRIVRFHMNVSDLERRYANTNACLGAYPAPAADFDPSSSKWKSPITELHPAITELPRERPTSHLWSAAPRHARTSSRNAPTSTRHADRIARVKRRVSPTHAARIHPGRVNIRPAIISTRMPQRASPRNTIGIRAPSDRSSDHGARPLDATPSAPGGAYTPRSGAAPPRDPAFALPRVHKNSRGTRVASHAEPFTPRQHHLTPRADNTEKRAPCLAVLPLTVGIRHARVIHAGRARPAVHADLASLTRVPRGRVS